MHKDTYPHLYKRFPIDNFETLVTVLERDYADLFPLAHMDEYFRAGAAENTSYTKFFESVFSTMNRGKYTEQEIQQSMGRYLQQFNPELSQDAFMFPVIRGGVSKPLGFVEKFASGHLSAAEPLSYVDMVRSTAWFTRNSKSFSAPNYQVTPLANLSKSASGSVTLVNLHPNPKDTPKWVVLDYRRGVPVVYCEAPILPSERKMLESKIGTRIPDENYEGGKAALSVSSGYTALAWCMRQVDSVCALKLDSDFSALVEEFTYIQPSIQPASQYLTPDYKRFSGRLYDYTRAVILGQLGRHEFKPNDLCAALPIYNQDRGYSRTVSEQTKQNARSYILGFDNALGKPTGKADKGSMNVGFIRENTDDERVSLTVPDNLSISEIRSAYATHAASNSVPVSWLEQYARRPYPTQATEQAQYATAMVLAVFRSCAKLANLEINLPKKYQLDERETATILKFMENNPYVCQLTLGDDNQSLKSIQGQLLHIFARNRWLRANGYKPPMFDDYWKNAAFHWLVHLNQTPDVLLDKKDNDFFKQCVTEMGIHGLKSVLTYLNNEIDRDRIDKLYGNNRPPFYINCAAEKMPKYLDTLLEHLEYQAYFPFSEIGVSYSKENAAQITRLIAAVNHLKNFEQVTLSDCLKADNKKDLIDFIHDLAAKAKQENWTTLVVIPELQDKENVSAELAEIRSAYAHLNNIILVNQRQQKAKDSLKQIEEISDFKMQDIAKVEAESGNKGVAGSQSSNDEVDFAALMKRLQHKNVSQEWSIQRGGETQLQLQQQQEIQQQRQLQQQNQRMKVHQVEEAFFEDLISYDNIDQRLQKFLKEYQEEHEVSEKYALLKTPSESLLKGFFHTWINANPEVPAKHTIRFMTKDAVVELLKHQSLFVSGLKADNLPKGFFLQRSKDGDYILSFKADMDYINPPNAQTIQTDLRAPVPEFWEGDFRQFDVDRYIEHQNNIDATSWKYMATFAALQPERDFTKDYDEFIQKNPHLARKFGGDVGGTRERITKHWLVVLQAWQYMGEKGIDQFLAQDPAQFNLSPKEIQDALIKDMSPDLKQFIEKQQMTVPMLKALGQVYYRFGNKGMSLFVSKLSQLESQLGTDFYHCFAREVLGRCDNYNTFMQQDFFLAADAMLQQLKGRRNEDARHAWMAVMRNHYQTTDWDDITRLWKAYSNFNQELARMGLTITADNINGIPPNNMIVYMDRVLDCLRHISSNENQKAFLSSLSKWDMSNGGLPYAIVNEKFRHFDESLQLTEFLEGTPTYSPNLADLYKWSHDKAPLQMQRSLASISQISRENFNYCRKAIAEPTESNRDCLVLLANTRYESANVKPLVENFKGFPPQFSRRIATAMHRTVYENGYTQLEIDWAAINALAELDSSQLLAALDNDDNLLLLEAISLLHQKQTLNQQSLDNVVASFNELQHMGIDLTEYHGNSSFKLGVVFDQIDNRKMHRLSDLLDKSKPIVQQEVRLLFRHILTVEFDLTPADVLSDPTNWEAIEGCIEAMNDDPANTGKHRMALIETLSDKGIEFRFSKGGNFRALAEKAEDRPESLRFFVDHEDRVWNFLIKHIAVKVDEDTQEQLAPIMNFLKQLQINVTYLNELEPLLSTLEQTEDKKYWSAQYFRSILQALTPEDEKSAFPISLMKTVLSEAVIQARPLDEVTEEFPQKINDIFTLIRGNTVFTRHEQATLAKLALREYHWSDNTNLTTQIINTLASDTFKNTRGPALDILINCDNKAKLEQRYQYCKQLALLPTNEFPQLNDTWPSTMSLWLQSMRDHDHVEDLFQLVTAKYQLETQKQAQILHIIAWSSLHPGLLNNRDHQYEMMRKAPKLVELLNTLSEAELEQLCQAYPDQPSPRATDIISLLKQDQPFSEALQDFEKHPFLEPRSDYHPLALSRQSDLERMLKEVQVSMGKNQRDISVEDCARLSLIFTYLKELESGQSYVAGSDKPIQKMSKQEIAESFNRLSIDLSASPDNALLQAQVFALMFEAMGRSTRKYPHLAQQFALIANEIFVKSDSRVLQLSVGEGKSHYVAMQAARYAAQGKYVDVCTSKQSLASRDLDDYKAFFNYLGLTSTAVDPKSSHENYMNHQIHYSTLGNLSLFLDEQNYAGTPIEIPKEQRVGLFDEFDFTRFEEGRKTEYNFARPSGNTPKQLMWFYQSINQFYNDNQELIMVKNKGKVNTEVLVAFANALIKDAGDLESRQQYVARFIDDPLKMVQYLQSAHEAARLEKGINFTVQDTVITVGEEQYPMREVIPLSSDNQRMAGSTFSAGVHQLLAVRLNSEAKDQEEPQNYHVHPESHILSSQVAAYHMQSLWGHREGFSGTISDVQKQKLFNDEETVVLQAPTNRRVQRKWHEPGFYRSDQDRANAITDELLQCLTDSKSVLICCTNDKQVTAVREQLLKAVPEQYHAQLMFYTNEDPRSPRDVLSDKRKQEQWHGDAKKQGMALIASGFGRGDNTGTEAVFVLGSRSFSELVQKGGRTARNGEEGDVHQFYITEELVNEEDSFRERLGNGTAEMQHSYQEVLRAYPDEEPNADKNRLHRVLILREYCFELDNIVNETYHHTLAQYSGWGMRMLASIDDPMLRNDFSKAFSTSMGSMEKRWIDIEAQQEASTEAKQKMIQEAFMATANDFLAHYNEKAETKAQPFTIKSPPKPMLDLTIPEQSKSRAYHAELASLFISITNLKDIDWTDPRIGQLPKKLLNLSHEPYLVRYLVNEMRHADSAKAYLDWFERFHENYQKPSAHWQEQLSGVLALKDNKEVLTEVKEGRNEFIRLMSSMDNSVQDKVAQYLQNPHPATSQDRVDRLGPTLRYLNQFSLAELEQWGTDYIDNIDIIHEHYSDMMQEAQSFPPIPFAHFKLFTELLRAYPSPHSLDNKTLFTRLNELTRKKPDMQIRILDRCEAIVSVLPENERSLLFHTLAEDMTQFIQDNHMNLGNRLLSNTANLLAHPKHKPGVINLWNILSENLEHLDRLTPLIDRTSSYAGSAWYTIPDICLNRDNATLNQLVDFQNIWLDFWENIDAKPEKSLHKKAYFKMHMERTRNLDAKAVVESKYDKFLQRCYRQIASRADTFEKTKAALNKAFDKIDRYGFENVMAFVNNFDQLMADEEGHTMSDLDMVYLYDMCRRVGISHDVICDHDSQRLLREFYGDMNIEDMLEEPEQVTQLQSNLETMQSINNATLCKQFVDKLKQHAKPDSELSTQDAMTLLYNCKMAGMNEKTFHRYQDVLITLWEHIDTACDTREKSFEAFAEYVWKLVEFDHDKLNGFINNDQGILGKPAKAQMEYLLGDVMNFSSSKQKDTRIWRMRFLLDGVLKEVRADPSYQWDNKKNNALLKEAFARFAKAFKKIFSYIVPTKRPSPAQRLKAHQQAQDICNEMQLIGNFNPINYADAADEKASLSGLKDQLSTALTEYQNSWFQSTDRKVKAERLREDILDTWRGGLDDHASLLSRIRKTKLRAMQDDIRLNETRWFKMNRSGRSRYYETLNQLQDLVMKHWASEQFDVEGKLDQQTFFQSNQTYQYFVKDDLRSHLKAFHEGVQPFLDQERNTNRYLYKGYYQGMKQDLSRLLAEVKRIENANDITHDDVNSLLPQLEACKKYLPGELTVILKEIEQRAQVMQDMPKPDRGMLAG